MSGARIFSAARTNPSEGSSTSGATPRSVTNGSSRRLSSGVIRCPASLVPPRRLDLVVREQHRLAADGEIAALRPADVVLGHQDPPQIRVVAEDDAEEVVDLA